jgi:hypothetical protein
VSNCPMHIITTFDGFHQVDLMVSRYSVSAAHEPDFTGKRLLASTAYPAGTVVAFVMITSTTKGGRC